MHARSINSTSQLQFIAWLLVPIVKLTCTNRSKLLPILLTLLYITIRITMTPRLISLRGHYIYTANINASFDTEHSTILLTADQGVYINLLHVCISHLLQDCEPTHYTAPMQLIRLFFCRKTWCYSDFTRS